VVPVVELVVVIHSHLHLTPHERFHFFNTITLQIQVIKPVITAILQMLRLIQVAVDLTITVLVTVIVTTYREIPITMETTLIVHQLDLDRVMDHLSCQLVMDKEVEVVQTVAPLTPVDTLTQ
tara:strand:- start:446 stop:811 length:366 start_codon:yes stop_codon:yes gene_type:complete